MRPRSWGGGGARGFRIIEEKLPCSAALGGTVYRMVGRLRLIRLAFGACLAVLAVGFLVPPAVADQARTGAVYDAQWALQSAHVQRVWALTRGQGVTVAVVDSGVDARHPDLVGRVTGGGDFGNGASGDGTHDSVSPQGHGTELASLIAATGRNFRGDGLLGLAPAARILSFGVYQDGLPSASAVAKAVRTAADDGAQVILAPSSPVMSRPAVLSAVRDAQKKDAVVVAGVGGNDAPAVGTAPSPVAATRQIELPGVVTVAAVDQDGQVWSALEAGTRVALAAPGVDILAAAPDGRYWKGSGSSFAASWVAGTAALVRAAHPHWTAAQTIERLIGTAQGAGPACGGDCGYGVVDPVRAVSVSGQPSAKVNPLLTAPAPRHEAATKSTATAVDPQRVLFFVVSAAVALLIYVGVTTVFIRRQRNTGY